MALGGGMSCVKYLLFIFNLLFAITGAIILVAGIKAEINAHPYINMTDENFYKSAPVIMILIGVIVFVVAFFGCCGAVRENHCMVVTFSVFLFMIFVAELSVGIAGYLKRDDLQDSLVKNLNESIKEYNIDKEVQNSFDILQTDLECCGIGSPSDWEANNLPIPDTCCAAREIKYGAPEACSPSSPHFHSDGCLSKLVEFFKSIAFSLGGVGLGIAVIQLLGVVFACCLARSIRSQYETV